MLYLCCPVENRARYPLDFAAATCYIEPKPNTTPAVRNSVSGRQSPGNASNDFYREGEADPFYSAIDETTGTKEVTWNVVDFDDDTMEFYFGTTEPAKGEIYEGVKAFVFDSKSGGSIAFARLKYVATLGGGINKTDPLQIQVSAKVLAPEQGGYSWWPITTPEYTKSVL